MPDGGVGVSVAGRETACVERKGLVSQGRENIS